MLTDKQAKKLGRNKTIDMRYKHNLDYVNKVDKKDWRMVLMDYAYIVFSALWAAFLWFLIFMAVIAKSEATQDLWNIIRQDRLNTCEQAYQESWISYPYWNKEMLVARCATYNWLMYAYESNFWKSNMCNESKNCHWLKMPSNKWLLDWINYTVWAGRFIKFDNFTDNNLMFARSYFTYHYKKDTTKLIRWYLQPNGTYAYGWSMTDTWTYIHFIDSNYRKMYNELEYLYRY